MTLPSSALDSSSSFRGLAHLADCREKPFTGLGPPVGNPRFFLTLDIQIQEARFTGPAMVISVPLGFAESVPGFPVS